MCPTVSGLYVYAEEKVKPVKGYKFIKFREGNKTCNITWSNLDDIFPAKGNFRGWGSVGIGSGAAERMHRRG